MTQGSQPAVDRSIEALALTDLYLWEVEATWRQEFPKKRQPYQDSTDLITYRNLTHGLFVGLYLAKTCSDVAPWDADVEVSLEGDPLGFHLGDAVPRIWVWVSTPNGPSEALMRHCSGWYVYAGNNDTDDSETVPTSAFALGASAARQLTEDLCIGFPLEVRDGGLDALRQGLARALRDVKSPSFEKAYKAV